MCAGTDTRQRNFYNNTHTKHTCALCAHPGRELGSGPHKPPSLSGIYPESIRKVLAFAWQPKPWSPKEPEEPGRAFLSWYDGVPGRPGESQEDQGKV